MRYNKQQLGVYRGVLKNKNLSKVVEEGLAAPVGSTKRKRAQKILSVIKKTSRDGQGGPGPRAVPRVNVQLKPQVVDYSNFMILGPTPPVRVKIGEKAPTPRPEPDGVHDGQGFAPAVAGLAALAPYAAMGAAKAAPYLAGAAKLGSSLWSGAKAAAPIASALAIPTFGVVGAATRDPNRGQTTETPKLNLPLYGSPALNNLTGKQPPQTQEQFIASLKGGGSQMPGAQPNPYEGMNIKDLSIGLAGGQIGGGQSTPATGFEAPKFAGLQSALQQGTGPSMFAYNTLTAGGDQLKALAPNASAEMMQGGGLYERLMRIEESTRKSFNLDQLRDNLNSMVMSGQTLEGNLTDYIRGRDEFLNETEGLIGDLKTRSMKMDMSDPRNQANMQQHFNYLYELRGRQNKRYVEFLKMSVDAYQGKIDRVKNHYDTEFSRYEQQVMNSQGIAREEYQMLFTGLQEMYTEAADAERKALELETLNVQLNNARMSAIYDAQAAEGLSSGDSVELSKVLATHNILDKNGGWSVTNNAVTLAGANVWRLPEVMEDALYRGLRTYDDKNNPTGWVSPSEALEKVGNVLSTIDFLEQNEVIFGEAAERRRENARNALSNYLKSSGQVFTTENLPSYEKAIQSLAGDGWVFNRTTPDRDKFLKTWGSQGAKLNDDVLNSIYTNYETGFKGRGREFVDTFLTRAGELGQGGDPIGAQSGLRNQLIDIFTSNLTYQPINPSGFKKVGGDTNSASLQKAANAISSIESGGNYNAIGPVTASGDRAYGRYQVMGNNIPSWTKEALGMSLTPQQFLANPAAQDAVFRHRFGGYVQKYGTYEDAASVWFSGRPLSQAGNARDILGTTVPAYVSNFARNFYA